uniref:VWFA domain-containing protein n=1 Tax=Pavo cristatus TaxID=9049 RepID=A0A8C9ERI0_PAVCR
MDLYGALRGAGLWPNGAADVWGERGGAGVLLPPLLGPLANDHPTRYGAPGGQQWGRGALWGGEDPVPLSVGSGGTGWGTEVLMSLPLGSVGRTWGGEDPVPLLMGSMGQIWDLRGRREAEKIQRCCRWGLWGREDPALGSMGSMGDTGRTRLAELPAPPHRLPHCLPHRLPHRLPTACPTSASDIVFLMDGSGSVARFDFQRMKIFIIEVIRRFRGTDTRVRGHGATGLPHSGALANGLTMAAPRNLWDGGDTVSDGDVPPQVGSAFKDPNAAAELQTIASAPPQAHVFRVDNFEALRGIQEQLQEKIFAIEGTRPAFGSSFQLEMAQEGFSALLTPEGAVLGAVGAYDWAGGVFIYGADGKVAFVNASEGDGGVSDAYLGYATESLSLGGLQALVLGAPRYRHVGRLLLFVLRRGGKWELRSDATGRQVGSYFGAALCALEGPGDGVALLVGVPMFYGDGTGGRVEVCTVLPQGHALRCHRTLRGQAGHPLGRFGTSVARLGDIDGDGLHDVAVGAPMEDDEHGAVYIFRGEKGGVSDHYSQRIAGSIFHSAPQHFGQALSGGRDLTGDRLPDVAVGAQGQVLLLRSPPLLKVEVTVTFSPPEIPISALDCQRAEEEQPSSTGAVVVPTAKVCFVGTKKSSDSLGESTGCGALPHGWASTHWPPVGPPHPLQLPSEPFESHRPSPTHSRWPHNSSNGGMGWRCGDGDVGGWSRRKQLGCALGGWDGGPCPGPQLPFEKNCGEDNQCVPDLRLALSFSGLEELVVGATEEVTITVTVHNVGEDAYGAHVELQHPKALSYRKATALQVPTGDGGTTTPQGLPHVPPGSPEPLHMLSGAPKSHPRCSQDPIDVIMAPETPSRFPRDPHIPLQMSPRPQISSSSHRILHVPTPQSPFRCPQDHKRHLIDPNPIQMPSRPQRIPRVPKTPNPTQITPNSTTQTPPHVPPHPLTRPPHSSPCAPQPHRRSLAQHCSSVSPGGGRILCNISHPVLWAGQQVAAMGHYGVLRGSMGCYGLCGALWGSVSL